MNAVSVIEQTMSSVEIAELTGKRHDNVMKDIEKMLEELEIRSPDFSGEQTFANNRKRKVFNLPKRECTILVSGYNIKMRAAIIDRWQELEQAQQPVPQIPQSLPEALRLAADLADKNAEQKQQLEAQTKVIENQKPVVKAFDRIARADNSSCVRDAAKILQVRPIDLTRWLSANRWIYKKIGSTAWLGYQDKVQTGYLEHKVMILPLPSGEEKIRTQVRVTPKGLTRLSKVFNQEVA